MEDQKELLEQIAALRRSAERQERRFRRAALRTVLIFMVLVFVAGIYSAALLSSIRRNFTPENVATVLTEELLENLPESETAIRESMRSVAKNFAISSVDTLVDLTNRSGVLLRDVLSRQSDTIFMRLEENNMPFFQKLLEESVEEVLANQKPANAEEFGKAVSVCLSRKIGEEMQNSLNRNLLDPAEALREKLLRLRMTPERELDRQSQCQKLFLLCMLDLSERAPASNDTRLADVIRLLHDTLVPLDQKLLGE